MRKGPETISTKQRCHIGRLAVCLVLFVSVICMFQVPAFADSATELFLMTESQFNSRFHTQINRIYTLIQEISLPIAVVGFATSCFLCLFGDQKSLESAKKRMLYILIAIVCLQLVPLVVAAAREVFSSYQYTPATTFDTGRNVTF